MSAVPLRRKLVSFKFSVNIINVLAVQKRNEQLSLRYSYACPKNDEHSTERYAELLAIDFAIRRALEESKLYVPLFIIESLKCS